MAYRACVWLICADAQTRVPPRKPPFASFPGLPRKAILPWMVLPAEGRVPHARNDGIGLAGASPRLATRYSFAPDDHIMPRLAYGLATRTRRPASLRENHFSRHFRAFPARRPTLPLASRSTSKGVPLGQADKIFPYISLPHRFPTHVGQQPLRKNTPLPRPGPRVCVKSWDQRISGIHHVEQRGET